MVGDVSGHGVHVAPSMAKLRHSIDGVLTYGAAPAEAVTAASRLLETNRPGSYATAFVSIYDPAHPRARVLRAPATRRRCSCSTTTSCTSTTRAAPSSASTWPSARRTTVTLPDEFELVAFTDGLVEEPGLSYDEGVDRLIAAVRALPARVSGQRRAERLVAEVIGTTGRDDVCVVMVRPFRRGRSLGWRPWGTTSQPGPTRASGWPRSAAGWATTTTRGDEADRADGVAHVVEQSLCWIGWSVFHADPRRPMFQRQNDLITQWGGPNADNVYRHARVEPGRRYRHPRPDALVRGVHPRRPGRVHAPADRGAPLVEVTASDLGIGEGDEFDFVVGEGRRRVPLPEGALTVSIREYYFDWREAEPALFTIECLDDDADGATRPAHGATHRGASCAKASTASPTRSSTGTATCARSAGEGVAQHVRPGRSPRPRASTPPATRSASGTSDRTRRSSSRSTRPPARYWSFQLYELAWFELVDVADRRTSLNHTQAAIDDDDGSPAGRVPRRPGCRRTGSTPPDAATACSRTGRSGRRATCPRPRTRVVPVGEVVRGAAAGDARRSTPPSGRAEMARPAPPPGLALPHLTTTEGDE